MYCKNPKICSVIEYDGTHLEKNRVSVISLREYLENGESKHNEIKYSVIV